MTKRLSPEEVLVEISKLLNNSTGDIIEDYLTIFQFLKVFGSGFTDKFELLEITREEFNESLEPIPIEIREFVFKTIEFVNERHDELGKIISKLDSEKKVKCVVIQESDSNMLH